MNIIVATSRGRGIKQELQKLGTRAEVIVRPGQKYKELVADAKRTVLSSDCPTKDIHVYFLAGYTDLTKMEKKGTYQEVTFKDSPEQAKSRLEAEIQNTATQITELGAKVCFATIIPGSIKNWNLLRKEQHKTSALKYEQLYDSWQNNLNKAVILCNKTIVETNIVHDMQTPKTHECVISMRKKGKHRFQYNKLCKDGVHPSKKSLELIARSLNSAIAKNRQQPNASNILRENKISFASPKHTITDTESEVDSPKRNWKAY